MSRKTQCEYEYNTGCTCIKCCKDNGLCPDCEYPTDECTCTDPGPPHDTLEEYRGEK